MRGLVFRIIEIFHFSLPLFFRYPWRLSLGDFLFLQLEMRPQKPAPSHSSEHQISVPEFHTL